jgi:ketosteroid isomerase-like protein
MSQDNVALVRGLQPSPHDDLAALVRDEAQVFEALAPFVHDDFIVGGDVGGAYDEGQGLAELKTAWADWLEPWETYRVEIDDAIDLGDDVVVLTRDYGRRAGMDMEVSVLGAAIWTVREGKIARIRFFTDRAAGLRAAGLDPSRGASTQA